MRSERELLAGRKIMTTVCISTAEGPVYLKFGSIQIAMEQIGAANLATLRRWNESLETQSFESSALAHVEGLESAKELEPGTCRVCMRPILNHSESQKDACIGRLRKARETTAELMSRVVDGVSVATSPRMVANAKRFNTPHAVEHDWTIACHAPPKCKRLEIPIEDEETGADSPKWLPWKLSPDSDPAERWILVSAENDEIEHPANEKYDTEAQAWIACERESK